MSRNIMLQLEFDGTNYSGWQKQNNAVSVCEIITSAIFDVTGESVSLTGCGRTDAGVHALDYVCNFVTNSNIPGDSFNLAINTKLPSDIVCRSSKEADIDFHARYSALSKRYIYIIQNTKTRSALYRNLHYCYPKPLDIELMQKAISSIVGQHDFRAFMASGSSVKDTVRTIYSLDINRSDDMIEIDICGSGFLYNMVRIITGTLIDVGIKKIKPEKVLDIIESKDRKKAGKTAPAHGLYLAEVIY